MSFFNSGGVCVYNEYIEYKIINIASIIFPAAPLLLLSSIIPKGIPINEENISNPKLRKCIFSQSCIKIISAIIIDNSTIKGVAMVNGMKKDRSGTAIIASPNPIADCINVAINIMIKILIVLLSIAGS